MEHAQYVGAEDLRVVGVTGLGAGLRESDLGGHAVGDEAGAIQAVGQNLLVRVHVAHVAPQEIGSLVLLLPVLRDPAWALVVQLHVHQWRIRAQDDAQVVVSQAVTAAFHQRSNDGVGGWVPDLGGGAGAARSRVREGDSDVGRVDPVRARQRDRRRGGSSRRSVECGLILRWGHGGRDRASRSRGQSDRLVILRGQKDNLVVGESCVTGQIQVVPWRDVGGDGRDVVVATGIKADRLLVQVVDAVIVAAGSIERRPNFC